MAPPLPPQADNRDTQHETTRIRADGTMNHLQVLTKGIPPDTPESVGWKIPTMVSGTECIKIRFGFRCASGLDCEGRTSARPLDLGQPSAQQIQGRARAAQLHVEAVAADGEGADHRGHGTGEGDMDRTHGRPALGPGARVATEAQRPGG